ncbi:MAG: tRNA preQ1(34) S-adenosylmethionine ribosyltransferase-isomerase QueA [bacterium]|nr:tRNA preQ1(34) S-adenosylmethionine ribosyltransferase-isomerase QueA [bacterium]
MKTSDFDYNLPIERIAQKPMRPRDHSRLMVLDRKSGNIDHKTFFEIESLLNAGDLLIINNSKVFRARLKTNDEREVFLLRPEGSYWHALLKPGKTFHIGDIVHFSEKNASATPIAHAKIVSKHADGTASIDFEMDPNRVIELTEHIGEIPTPPYVESITDNSDYQTVYAKDTGSVAAPTAGFHFTPELIEKIKTKGVQFAEVTLHVGLGTFRPMRSETIEEHEMHEEWINVPDETQNKIKETKAHGGRVIAVGTTTVRALESNTQNGFTRIFITPGYTFKVIDGLITNFHLPKSTLLVLVSAFAGRDNIMNAYTQAIENEYRFYSFGDAMFIG